VTVRSVIKSAEWTIGADRSDGASPPIREIQCTTCHERSEPSTGQLGPDVWAIAHTGATGHDGFREIVTAFLRVVPAPGNPLYEEQA
jgi:cytochrome c2